MSFNTGKYMGAYSLEDGKKLVVAARNSIELYLKDPKFEPKIVKETLREFSEPAGVFVTLRHYPVGTPRGHAGFSEPIAPLGESLVEASIAAAFGDQRFVPVSHRELEDIVIEVDVLSSLQKINGGEANRLRRFSLGKHGILIKYGMRKGLMMPGFPIRHGLSKVGALSETCVHAGLPQNYWKQPNVSLFYFTTYNFVEESPYGRVLLRESNIKGRHSPAAANQ
ncbi:MAG: TIGR00296 family protein [Candidatus Micrarchaeaceae archaeon]